MLQAVARSKNLRRPGRMTLEEQFDVAVAVSISMCWCSQLFVPGLWGCLQEPAQCVTAHPCSGHPAGRELPAPLTLKSLKDISCPFERGSCPFFLHWWSCKGMLSAVLHTGNVQLSFPSCMAANVHPNLSNTSSYTDP